MSKKPPDSIERLLGGRRASLSARLEMVRYLNTSSARRAPVQQVADALVRAGYTSLDEQAKALGIQRSTAWTIMRNKHKLGHLNAKTTERMLANPELPRCIRDVLQRYAAEKRRPERGEQRAVTQSADNAGED